MICFPVHSTFIFPMFIHQRPLLHCLGLSLVLVIVFSSASPSSASAWYFSYRRHPHSPVPAASSLALLSLPLLVEGLAFVIVYIPFVSCIIILKPPWPNGLGVGLLIRRLRARAPRGALANQNSDCSVLKRKRLSCGGAAR